MIRHIIYWLWVMAVLVFYFAYDSDWNFAFYFVSFLTPVALGTTYFFNYHLVPQYLLKRRYFLFSLYFAYTLIISFYLEMIVIILSLVILANFDIKQMSPESGNIVHLSIVIYLIVFVTAFLKLIKQIQAHNQSISNLRADNTKLQKPFINIRVDRKDYNLSLNDTVYIESLADFVKVHLVDQHIVTKEKISALQMQLPSNFIRLHRSYIVNRNFVSTFNKEKVEISVLGQLLPISRTFKKEALKKLSTNTDS